MMRFKVCGTGFNEVVEATSFKVEDGALRFIEAGETVAMFADGRWDLFKLVREQPPG